MLLRDGNDGVLINAVRGFPLKGEILEVPETHKAIVLQETQKPMDGEKMRNLYVTGCFEKFHYWNYDKVPSKSDAYKQALQMFDISEELSASVSDMEIQAEIERKMGKSVAKEN